MFIKLLPNNNCMSLKIYVFDNLPHRLMLGTNFLYQAEINFQFNKDKSCRVLRHGKPLNASAIVPGIRVWGVWFDVYFDENFGANTFWSIILEGVAKSSNEPERAYRGYVAVDDISISPLEETEGVCHGHCTFEGGMCGWTNEPEADDFDWKLGRGSDNFFTGPARDYYSFSKEYPLGGFLYISAAYPRRPGDKAVLISPSFPATVSGPFCFKFATHMYGNGIGTLRVKYRPGESKDDKSDKILWEMSGESGNNWYQAQLPIASAVAFNIIFEGIIGPNYLGNIAIDSISIEQGVCPISPQTAARKSGDCTFEENMCYWTNPLPHSGVDDFDWIRQFSFGNYGPKHDHTKKNANGYFLSLNGDAIQPLRGGTSAWIISPEFESN
ncbi:MAM and LDL-receptor class A domain-containing protein 1-like, partial [Tetranychus urticae]|uniref:MAM and LDL-receptor class A domain-containing protein 1-like n=1 Tax=Tetranychus urticae TaxID=32264 RepID=UPI00077BDA84